MVCTQMLHHFSAFLKSIGLLGWTERVCVFEREREKRKFLKPIRILGRREREREREREG